MKTERTTFNDKEDKEQQLGASIRSSQNPFKYATTLRVGTKEPWPSVARYNSPSQTFFSIRVESLGVEVLQRQELFVKINKRLSFLNFGYKSKLNHLPIKHEQELVDIFGHCFLSIAV